MLVIAMVTGVLLYVGYRCLDFLHPVGPAMLSFCTHVQPILIFSMLFLTFLKIEPSNLKPVRWHFILLLIQGGVFTVGALTLYAFPNLAHGIALESFLLCMICPTATACAVVTQRLGGDTAQVLSYTIMINLLASILIPLMVPLINPAEGVVFITAFTGILSKIFPMLILPCVCAWALRYLMPRLHSKLVRYSNLSFYIWSFALTFAIMMSTRSLFRNPAGLSLLIDTAVASLIACILQFSLGKRIGGVTAGQSLGQKNTVFAIWLGYTFLNPVTSLAGGFYCIWHNLYNTRQLRKAGKN